MADPTTTNILLSVPTRGSDPGTWDLPVNGNSNALDGYFGGVQTISLSNTPVTLTAPAGIATPGAGPFQSQNAILRFTGALSGAVQITLPLPGFVIVENLTTGAFVLSFRALGSGEVIAIPQGALLHIYNDGTNVRFVKGIAEFPGKMDFLGGVNAIPSWISSCSVPPFLLADGSIYNFSTYPALGALYLGNFGGNGITTFGVPDLRGRVPLAYDGTGTRITVAGCGINGQTLGATGGQQNETLLVGNLPPYTPAGTVSVTSTPTNVLQGVATGSSASFPNGSAGQFNSGIPTSSPIVSTGVLTGAAQGGASTPVITVPPSQVSGIWMIKT